MAYEDLVDRLQSVAMQAAMADQWTWHKRGDLGRLADGGQP